jgi:hypothetical protein
MKPYKSPHHGMDAHDKWAFIILGIVVALSIAFVAYITGRQPQIPEMIPTNLLRHQGPMLPAQRPASAPVSPLPHIQFDVILPHIATGTAVITDASPAVFAYAHGTAMAGNKFVIGMANREGNPFVSNKLLFFTDPQYLNRYLTVLFPHLGDVETMTIDPVSGDAYFLLTGSKNLELYRFDPHTLILSAVASSTSIDPGAKPAIVSDGTYVYGITDTVPSTVFKVKLSDGTVDFNPKGHISHGHSAAIGIYPNSTELYFGGGLSDGFEKADAATLAPIKRVDLSPCTETDDMPYQKIDDTEGYIYVGCEFQPYGYRIRTVDLNASRFLLPGSSLGVFIFGDDLYNAAQDGRIDIFPGLNLADLERYHIASSSLVDNHHQEIEPNELFFASSTQSLYFTAWYGTPGLFRVSTSTE